MQSVVPIHPPLVARFLFRATVCALTAFCLALPPTQAQRVATTLCATTHHKAKCDQLSSSSAIKCIIARDRLECMHKVQQGVADLVSLGSNEAYATATDFTLEPFQEEITIGGDFLYEAVVVVKKTLRVKSLSDLKGKTTCHTGYGRTAGWDSPMALFTAQNIFGEANCGIDLDLAAGFFSRSCIPGHWSKDLDLDKALKSKHSNLCELCQKKCETDDSDPYLGYEGSLRCLTEKSADVAFTKFVTVVEYAKQNPNFSIDHRYLCPDGNLKNLSDVCFWSARPNPLLVVDERLPEANKTKILADVNVYMKTVGSVPSNVLFYRNTSRGYRNVTKNIKDYLNAGNFTITMDKPLPDKCKEKYARLCVISDVEKRKCQDLKTAAYALRMRPHLECIRKDDSRECLDEIANRKADLHLADAYGVFLGATQYEMQSVAKEIFPRRNNSHFVVAVIQNSSGIKLLKDLKGRKTCFPSAKNAPEWMVSASTLIQKKTIVADGCSYATNIAQFFGPSCAPGGGTIAPSLCQLCKGNKQGAKCEDDDGYGGQAGALRCLSEGGGEAAFVSHVALLEFRKTLGKEGNFSLLCPNEQVKPIDQYESCNWAEIPGKRVFTNYDSDALVNFQLLMMRTGSKFTNISGLLQIFADYDDRKDILFSSEAIGFLTESKPVSEILDADLRTKFELLRCSTSATAMLSLSTNCLFLLFLKTLIL